MPSFDVVSKTDLAEVDNALANMTREMSQRYDFKNSNREDRAERGRNHARMPTTTSSSSRCTSCCKAISPAARSTPA